MTATPVFRTDQDLEPIALRTAFGLYPTGVVAVAADIDGELTGLAASSFTSVSLDPPLVSISIANTSKTWSKLRGSRRVGVTVLADHHGPAARRLAGPVEARFDGLSLKRTELGAVTLTDGLAQFDTSLYSEVEAGDHTIVLLRLHAIEHIDTVSPLVFHRSTFRSLQHPHP